MNIPANWIHIFIAVGVYIIVALISLFFLKKKGEDLKVMSNRSTGTILLTRLISNISIMLITILLLIFADHRSIGSLGLSYSGRDIIFTNVSVVAIFLLALVFVGILSRYGRTDIKNTVPFKKLSEVKGFLEVMLVLLIVALQEEVLFRGYLTLNLMTYGPAATIILTSLIFALIHILTNRTSLYQFFSWLLAGGIFACAYLVTGSIWIPVIIHFATDLINTFVFNIVGKYSMYEFTPAIDDKHRMVYRIGYTAVLLILLLSFYGGNLKIF